MPEPDATCAVERLQHAARRVAEHLTGERAVRVRVIGEDGATILDVRIPFRTLAVEREPEAPEPPAAGWAFTDRAATLDGNPVKLTARSLAVLKVLAGTEVADTDDLRTAYGGYQCEDATIRWQIGELRKALKKAVPDFPGEVIEATGSGYRLVLR